MYKPKAISGSLRYLASGMLCFFVCFLNKKPVKNSNGQIQRFTLYAPNDSALKVRATCFATLLQNELNSNVACFTIHIKAVLQQIRLLTGLNVGGKMHNSTIQLSNVAKQVAGFFLPVFPYLYYYVGRSTVLQSVITPRGGEGGEGGIIQLVKPLYYVLISRQFYFSFIIIFNLF